MQKNWYIGCSGFHYKEWKELFYPKGLPQSRWFDYYAKRFNTLELNVTFYRFPKIPFLKSWYDKAPDDFLFSAKVPRSITHYRHLKGDSKRMLDDFYGLIKEGLGNKTGSVLFQLPKQLEYSDETLHNISEIADPGFTNVVEFRHESWWNKKVYQYLKKNKIVFCGHSYPKLADDVIINEKSAYYRFHGVPKLYKSSYSNKFLKEVLIALENSKSKTNYLYFNNTWGMSAINNALFIQKELSKLEQ